MKKKFIITIDTEGDNLWGIRNSESAMRRITNRNGGYIERFQLLCERYGYIPTYLTNYEMAQSEPFREVARAGLRVHRLEIGMHLHAFNSPPFYNLTDRSGGNKAYAGEYPPDILDKKTAYLTKLLEDRFQTPIRSHRGGRWYLDAVYMNVLKKYGYMVDCTVTPGMDWTENKGQTSDSKGVDYRRFPKAAYEMEAGNPERRGDSGIVEVPVSVKPDISVKRYAEAVLWGGKRVAGKWFRPTGNNLNELIEIVEWNKKKKVDYIEFMLHSSELMPGGSPTFAYEWQIEKLYGDLEELFSYMSADYEGVGLTEYAQAFLAKGEGDRNADRKNSRTYLTTAGGIYGRGRNWESFGNGKR